MLVDVSGQLIFCRGRLPSAQSPGLAALAAASFAAGREIGDFLGLKDGYHFRQQLLEGGAASLYTVVIDNELLLVIAFTQQTMLGLVRMFAGQAQKELLPIARAAAAVRRHGARGPDSNLENGFGQAVAKELDTLFDHDS